MGYPTTPATFPTHNAGDIVHAAELNAYANELEAMETGWLTGYGQTLAPFRLRGVNPCLEFGDGNAAGGGSTLSYHSGDGTGGIGLHLEQGTNANTYKTRGIPGVFIAGSPSEAFRVLSAPTASADNQAPQLLMGASNGGIQFTGQPVCRLRMTAPPTVSPSVVTPLGFDTEEVDAYGMHAAGGSAVTIPAGMGGWYLITGSTRFAPQSNGYRQLFIALGGTAICVVTSFGVGNVLSTNLSVIWLVQLVAGNVVDLRVNHTAVAAIVVGDTVREQQSQFALVRVA